MNKYTVNLYREMRLSYAGIEADTPEGAVAAVSDLPTDDADNVEDCDGENISAVVDLAGDETYSRSVTIDFAGERARKAAPQLLAALERAAFLMQRVHDGDHRALENLQSGADQAREAINAATTACPPWASGDIDISALLARQKQIAAIWSVEDVEEIRPDLDDEQAWAVLQAVADRHDCDLGISWATLEIIADDLYPGPEGE
jgi:hypothetical protein